VSTSRVIHAPAAAIFDLLADPRQHHLLDGSGSVVEVKDAPPRLFLGATFTMRMKMGVPYVTKNVVVAFEENKTIAWHHGAKNVWRYDLSEFDGETTVTESFTYDTPAGLLVALLGFPRRNLRAMKETLSRLEKAVTSSR